MKPLVTIGIPLYNEEKFIQRTLSSALGQTYSNIRVIVSDNGSTDKSPDIVREIAKNDNRVTLYAHPKNFGPFFNFRFLLDKAESPYFMWLGGHDLMASTYIEDAVNKLEGSREVVMVFPKTGTIADDGLIDDLHQDDFEVKGLSIPDRILKIVRNSNRGEGMHGVYRTEVLKKSMLDINGGDLFVFLNAASHGSFTGTDKIAFYRRNVRREETHAETDARYIAYGFKPNWRLIHAMYPFQVIANLKNITLGEKLKLIRDVKDAMSVHRKNNWKEMFFYFAKQFKLKTAFLIYLASKKGKTA